MSLLRVTNLEAAALSHAVPYLVFLAVAALGIYAIYRGLQPRRYRPRLRAVEPTQAEIEESEELGRTLSPGLAQYSANELERLTAYRYYRLRSGRVIGYTGARSGASGWRYEDSGERVKPATVRGLFIRLRRAKANEPGEMGAAK